MFEGRVARSFEAISRKDLEAMMRNMTDDAVWEYPGNTPMSGRFEGKPAIRDWWRRWLERMASVRFTVKHVAFANPVTLTWANTVIVEWEADIVTADGLAARPEGITVWRFRHGKCTHARDYFDDTAMLETIWGRREPAPAGA